MALNTAFGRRTLASEGRAILAAARKEWIIFRRYPSWIFAVLVWPVLLPFAYIFTARALSGPGNDSLGAFAGLTGTSDYVAFIIIGTTLWGWLNMTLWDVGFHLRNEQMRGTLESNWLCPVPRLAILCGATLTKLAISFFALGLTVVEFWLLFDIQLVRGNVGLLLLVIVLVLPAIYGIGIAFGSLVIRFKEANAMVFLVRGIFMVFCGVAFPLTVLPGWMQRAADLLPLTYAIRDVRAITLTNATFTDLQGDLLRLALFALALPIAGALAFRLTERQARRTGALGQY